MRKFRDGDKVKIRSWESMKNEYGLVADYILIPRHFTGMMKHLCGKETFISGVTVLSDGQSFFMKNKIMSLAQRCSSVTAFLKGGKFNG